MNDLKQDSKREAIKAAVSYLKDVLDSKEDVNIKLEEIDQTEDNKYWLITLSYDDITLENLFDDDTRTFKVFKIEKDSNNVVSMKLREYEHRRGY